MAASILAMLLLGVPLLPVSRAAASDAPAVEMVITVGADYHEALALSFSGMQRLARYTDICLPLGASVTSVHDSLGDAPYDTSTDAAGRASVSFTARTSQIEIDMARATPPSAATAPFFENNANFCVPSDSALTVKVVVPSDHTLFFLNHGGSIAPDGHSGRIELSGPVHAFYSYEAPLASDSGLTLIEEGPFRIAAPTARAEQAREVARDATPALAAALREAGLAMPAPALRVRYAAQTEFSWEAGHYDGHGLTTVRENSLEPDPTAGFPYTPAKVLVHESFHAASAWAGRGDVEDAIDWFLEGSARHSESFVDAVLPNASHHCERTSAKVQCWSFDDRISATDLAKAYSGAFKFQTAWDPAGSQTDEARQLQYAYGGYVVGAYVERNGAASYQKAWKDVEAAFADGAGCPCGSGWLLGRLANATDGRDTAEGILAPWGGQTASAREIAAKDLLRDDSAMQRELDSAKSFLPVPTPALPVALGLVALAAAVRRRRS